MSDEGKVFGPYVTIRKLGAGGMGVVYQARHQVLGTFAAIKVLKAEWTAREDIVHRFIKEAIAAARLKHRNIVRVLDCVQAPNGEWWIALEYLEGMSLSDYIRTGATRDPALACLILVQAANALQAAHSAGIVHRDVKPDNVFLSNKNGNDLHVDLLDFGIAKLGEKQNAGATRTGVVMGTPSYMAPEQHADAKHIDGRADVYALGVMVFEMLTGGWMPWGQDTSMSEIYRRMTSELPPDPRALGATVSAPLAETVRRALQCDPRKRWQTPAEFAFAFAECVPATSTMPSGLALLDRWAAEVRGAARVASVPTGV
jgi:serine/threonine-protein kinase